MAYTGGHGAEDWGFQADSGPWRGPLQDQDDLLTLLARPPRTDTSSGRSCLQPNSSQRMSGSTWDSSCLRSQALVGTGVALGTGIGSLPGSQGCSRGSIEALSTSASNPHSPPLMTRLVGRGMSLGMERVRSRKTVPNLMTVGEAGGSTASTLQAPDNGGGGSLAGAERAVEYQGQQPAADDEMEGLLRSLGQAGEPQLSPGVARRSSTQAEAGSVSGEGQSGGGAPSPFTFSMGQTGSFPEDRPWPVAPPHPSAYPYAPQLPYHGAHLPATFLAPAQASRPPAHQLPLQSKGMPGGGSATHASSNRRSMGSNNGDSGPGMVFFCDLNSCSLEGLAQQQVQLHGGSSSTPQSTMSSAQRLVSAQKQYQQQQSPSHRHHLSDPDSSCYPKQGPGQPASSTGNGSQVQAASIQLQPSSSSTGAVLSGPRSAAELHGLGRTSACHMLAPVPRQSRLSQGSNDSSRAATYPPLLFTNRSVPGRPAAGAGPGGAGGAAYLYPQAQAQTHMQQQQQLLHQGIAMGVGLHMHMGGMSRTCSASRLPDAAHALAAAVQGGPPPFPSSSTAPQHATQKLLKQPPGSLLSQGWGGGPSMAELRMGLHPASPRSGQPGQPHPDLNAARSVPGSEAGLGHSGPAQVAGSSKGRMAHAQQAAAAQGAHAGSRPGSRLSLDSTSSSAGHKPVRRKPYANTPDAGYWWARLLDTTGAPMVDSRGGTSSGQRQRSHISSGGGTSAGRQGQGRSSKGDAPRVILRQV